MPRRVVRVAVAVSLAVGALAVLSRSASAAAAGLGAEELAGTDVLTGSCPPPGDAGSLPFTASGTATGPYPGTFTETGYWELDLEVLSAFHASFTITSGATTISGTADFATGSPFAACDGRAYGVPTAYSATVASTAGSTQDSGSSTVNIVYGSFDETFASASAPAPLSVTTASVPPATRGIAYATQLQAAGGTAPYRWHVSGKLPRGLRLDRSSGALIGTPRAGDVPGDYTVTVRASDHSKPKLVATQVITLTLG